ncbi:MAG: InlB B-repeat-containing protein [Clostridia bacterium]|nr:InlB B-repeat-containing protein [Clostridia bacterium]
MKKTYRRIALILILLLATLISLTACNLSGIGDALKTDIAKCDISLSATVYQYTGQEIRPDVTVKYFNKVLELDTDYGVEYSNNIDVGKGQIKISGRDKFNGEVTKEFDIVKELENKDPDLSSGDVSPKPDPAPEEKFIEYKFIADGAELVDGQLNQRVKSADQIVAPVVTKRGYQFVYWTYEGEEVDFDDVDTLPQQDAIFVAEFSIITYTVEYNLNGGENSSLNKSEYTVEDIFQLQDATRYDKKFVGWYLDQDFDEKLTSLSGVAYNLVLYAKFVDFDYKKTLSYVLPADVDGEYQEVMLYPGTALTRPAEVLSTDGSKKLVWYVDEDMTVRHNLRYMPDADLTLYARWEDKLYAGFLDKGWYDINDIKSIDSYEDMLAYVEFIYFYNITEEYTKSITYVNGAKNIKAEFSKAIDECTFPKMTGITYNGYPNNTGSVWMHINLSEQATLSATAQEDYYPQIGHVFNNYVSNRRVNFDDFAINYVDKTYECTTSDQLFYVLSHGYCPLPVRGSIAYRIYNKFKEIMRGICDDRMTDLQKARAIFDWLIINVYYDNNVADTTLPQASYKYNAFYLEGVLNGSAVCDGLSKAYSVMCAIEGIDCVRVTGTLKDAKEGDAGHAWNKIQIMGEWFLSDSTWGNRVIPLQNDNYEYLNGQYFLFTDLERSEIDNYNSDQYSQYVADSEFNYYDNFNMQLEIVEKNLWGIVIDRYDRSFDLYIDGDTAQGYGVVDEMSYVFEYIDKNIDSLEGMSFCIMLGEDMAISKIEEALNVYRKRVGSSKAKISRYSLIGDVSDIIDPENKIYRAGSILTIILSLPQTGSEASIQEAA